MARERVMQFDRHMSDAEALMWNLEKDPALSSWFASITILDTTPDFDRLRAKLSVAARDIIRLRQRVTPAVGRLSPPEWTLDPAFDLDYHIRRTALPSPGTDQQLYELAIQLLTDPFERTRPLWRFLVIEGLEGGRAALFQKMHHTITDGEGGVRLSEKFMEFSRDEPAPEVVDFTALGDVPRPEPTGPQWALGHNARRLGGLAERAARNIAKDPVGSATGVAGIVGELTKLLSPSKVEGERVGSPLWTERSLRRYYSSIQVPFAPAKAAAKALGGTLNDFFVAGALLGVASYHQQRDAMPDKVRMAMPVSTRKGGTAGGNQFAVTTTDMVPETDPVKAFARVREGLSVVKSGGSVDVLGSLAMVINLLPTSVLTKFARDQAGTVDFTVSNVRGAPMEVYISGAKCEAIFPIGPIANTGFNLTTISYAGKFDMGLVVDTAAVTEPEALRECLVAAFASLIDAAT